MTNEREVEVLEEIKSKLNPEHWDTVYMCHIIRDYIPDVKCAFLETSGLERVWLDSGHESKYFAWTLKYSYKSYDTKSDLVKEKVKCIDALIAEKKKLF